MVERGHDGNRVNTVRLRFAGLEVQGNCGYEFLSETLFTAVTNRARWSIYERFLRFYVRFTKISEWYWYQGFPIMGFLPQYPL